MDQWSTELFGCWGFFSPACESCLTMQSTNEVTYCKLKKNPSHACAFGKSVEEGGRKLLEGTDLEEKVLRGGLANLFSESAAD